MAKWITIMGSFVADLAFRTPRNPAWGETLMGQSFKLGLGVIDVKSETVESPQQVASRVDRALAVMGPESIVINPDCGLRHLPTKIALARLCAMNAGAALVRARVRGEKVPQLT